MSRRNVLAPAELFAEDAPTNVVPLVTGPDIRTALRCYRVPVWTLALTADLPESVVEHRLAKRTQVKGVLHDWYRRMRAFELRITRTIERDIAQYQRCILPRFLSDRHMAMYSPQDWTLLPSARLAAGISAWVSSHYRDASGKAVHIHDFNQVQYAQWLDRHDLDHDASALDFWLTQNLRQQL